MASTCSATRSPGARRPLFTAGVAIAFVHRDPLGWAAGAVAGASAAMYMMLRDSPPQYVEKWRRGAEGERATARKLGPLRRDGWQLFHDLETGRGNRDHVAVSPSGVYLLDSKNLSGTVTIDGDVMRARYRDYPRENHSLDGVGSWMRSQAAALHDEIKQLTGETGWVRAVVVIWGNFPDRLIEGNNVTFIHGDDLIGWLREHPQSLDDRAMRRVLHALNPSASGRPRGRVSQ